MSKIIRTSKHCIKFANKEKRNSLCSFVAQCRKVISQYVDYLWMNPYSFKTKTLDIQNEKYDVPKFISNVELESKIPNFNSFGLSARVRKCLLTQTLGIIKSAIEKQRKRKFQIDTGKTNSTLLKNYRNNFNKKPNISSVNIELNSLCCSVISSEKEFNIFLKLSSLGKTYKPLYIPLKFHKHSNKFLKSGFSMMSSFLISTNNIDIRWTKEIPYVTSGKIVGADQGKRDILNLSDGQNTPKENTHGHSLDSILKKLSRKKKGSKSFHKAQEHRNNFIRWSLNQLNISGIKQINLENVKNLFYKRHTSRLMSHWSYALIAEKVKALAEISGVHVQLNSSTYRSQRCCACGLVLKSNRKGKQYSCSHCGNAIDADLNASKNHEIELPEIPFDLRNSKRNIQGFFWLPSGFFSMNGEEFIVPLSENKQIVNKN